MPAGLAASEEVLFDKTKYGRELLVDCAWLREMPTFMRSGPHHLTFHEILLVTKGRGLLHMDGDRYEVRPGMVFFTRPYQIRHWETVGLEGLCLFFPSLFLDEFFQETAFVDRLPYFSTDAPSVRLTLGPRAARSLHAPLLAMRREFSALKPDSPHLIRAKLYETLIVLARAYAETFETAETRTIHPVVSRYRKAIERHATKIHRVSDYARRIGVTPGHLNALCRENAHQSAKDLLQDYLILTARRALLYSNETIERIGYRLGFRDPSYFVRFFRRRCGQSPGAFRAAHRPAKLKAIAASASPARAGVRARQ